jgi:hypothetical protein
MAAVPPASPAPAALPPPATPAEAALVRLIGAEATLKLIEAHGGRRLDVPRSVNQGSLLPRQIGLLPARILVERYAGGRLRVPLARAWRARIYRERDGLSYAEIAVRLGASDRSVWRWLSDAGCTGAEADAAGAAARQMDLFGG